MKKIRWNAVFVVLTFCVCILVICWSAVKIDRAITVSTAVPEDDLTIILDAGHGGYALSIVASNPLFIRLCEIFSNLWEQKLSTKIGNFLEILKILKKIG